MNRKAQITYFILLAFIIFIAAGFIAYINSNKKYEEIKVPLEAQPIQFFVESCIKNTGKDAVLFVSEHGGYYDLPNPHYSAFSLDVPYYFYQNLPFNPSKEQIEKQISNYMNENLFFCFRNFADFKKQGDEIEFNAINTKTIIIPNGILFELYMPVKIKKQNVVASLDNYIVQLDNIGLNKIIEFNNLVLQQQTKDPNSICLNCILNWTVFYDLRLHMNRVDNNTILFIVLDNKTVLNQNPLELNFANKYETFSCTNLPLDDIEFVQQCAQEKIQNETPELEIKNIPEFTAKVGQTFSYMVEADGHNIIFEDFTDLFEINQSTGQIKFTPNSEQIGEHIIWIKAKDKFGQEKQRNFRLMVIE